MDADSTGERSAFALVVLAVTVVLALTGDALLRGTAWGLNLPLWVLLTLGCAVGLLRHSRVTLSRAAKWLALPVVVFSLCFVWRDSDGLKVANGFALAVAVGVLAQRAQQGRPQSATVLDYTGRIVLAWMAFVGEFVNLVGADLNWQHERSRAGRLRVVARGLALAAPVVTVLGFLFARADAAFNQAAVHLFSIDFGDASVGALVTIAFAIVVGGLFRRLLLPARPLNVKPPVDPEARLAIHPAEFVVALGAIDALFVTFVGFQVRYLFGGAARVESVAGLTYAEYARSGFFELTFAALLVLPLLIGAQALARRATSATRAWFLALGAVLTGCVLVVLLSAADRMQIYVDSYGLSELRVFTTIFIAWIAVVTLWLSVSFFLHRRCFAFGALVAGYAFVILANAINPDALIARTDLRMPRSADLAYLSSLSLDAAPAVSANARWLPPPERAQLVSKANQHWRAELRSADWKAMNLARLRYLCSSR